MFYTVTNHTIFKMKEVKISEIKKGMYLVNAGHIDWVEHLAGTNLYCIKITEAKIMSCAFFWFNSDTTRTLIIDTTK